VLALFAVYGYASGAIKQLSHWVGVALAYLCDRPATAALAPFAAKWSSWPPSVVGVVLSCGLFFVFLLAGSEAGRRVLMRLFRGRQNGPVDHALGSALGAGKAAAVLFALLSGLLYFENPRAKASDGFDAAMKDSVTIAFVRRHNLFSTLRVPALTDIEKRIAPAKAAAKR
jgi:uncharacterized membrane protein required for colicin V production